MTLRIKQLREHVQRLLKLTHGQDLIEYGLLIALISTTIVVTLSGLGVKVPALYSSTAAALPSTDGDSGGNGPGNGKGPGNNPGNGGGPGNGKGPNGK